ncbi:MAG: aspartate-semialdehyde dehydrogenase [Elusimicrobiota bacterium]
MNVGVVGATGIVGRELLKLLERRRFPVTALRLFSSGRRRVRLRFRGRSLPAPRVDRKALLASDLVFLVSDDAVARRWAPAARAAGIWTIDESAAFRMRRGVPLVIPEINGEAISPKTRLIASPNCTVTGLAVAAHALHRAGGARSVRLASYQAVSGAGRDALLEFSQQVRNAGRRLPPGEALPRLPRQRSGVFPQPISFNILPQVGSFDAGGESGEETKVRDELRKLWRAPGLRVAATAVRVPVFRGHSLAVLIETRRHLTPGAAKRLLRRAPGVRLWEGEKYPTVHAVAGSALVHVGRVRASGAAPNELAMWIVSDNLLKGAALNTVQIAEYLLKKGWLA